MGGHLGSIIKLVAANLAHLFIVRHGWCSGKGRRERLYIFDREGKGKGRRKESVYAWREGGGGSKATCRSGCYQKKVSLQSTPNSEYQACALPQIGPLDKSPGAVVGPVQFSLSINSGFGLINSKSGRETCLLAVVNIQCSRLPCCLAAGLFRESSGSGKCVGQHAEISSFQACCTESFFFFQSRELLPPL